MNIHIENQNMSIPKLQNYALGRWQAASGGERLHHAITGVPIFEAGAEGLDFAAMMDYARQTGNVALRRLSFHDRGRMLKALALYLLERKEHYYRLSTMTGATRADSWIDIEGGIGNLFANASLRRQFPDLPYYVDGQATALSKKGNFIGHHIM